MSVSDQMLAAYVDGELRPDERGAVEAAIAADPALAVRLAADRRVCEQVRAAFAGVAEEPVPQALLNAVTAGVGQTHNAVSLRPWAISVGPKWIWASSGALAAGLALGFFLASAMLQPGRPALIGPSMAARGELAQALDKQLASQQGRGPIRIGVTFRATDGYICRTFEASGGDSVAGLACRRSSGAWIVRMAVSAKSSEAGIYQTAASRLPQPVAELAQSLGASQPLSAEDEVAAKAAGWR